MKKKISIISGLIIIMSGLLYSADKDQQAMEFIKSCIEKANTQNAYLNVLRYFQYTATTEKNNPWSYILSSYGAEALAESGIDRAEKGKYITVLQDRSAKRIKKLWDAGKKDIFAGISTELYTATIGSLVESCIDFHDSKVYRKQINAMKKKSPRLDNKTVEKAGEISQWANYGELAFWYRRTKEKNDRVVYSILREIRDHYKQ